LKAKLPALDDGLVFSPYAAQAGSKLAMSTSGSASLHPRAGSPQPQQLGWGARLYADASSAGWSSEAMMIELRFDRWGNRSIRRLDTKTSERAVFESYFSSQHEFMLFVGSGASVVVGTNHYPLWS
jgi:hypothetical protein